MYGKLFLHHHSRRLLFMTSIPVVFSSVMFLFITAAKIIGAPLHTIYRGSNRSLGSHISILSHFAPWVLRIVCIATTLIFGKRKATNLGQHIELYTRMACELRRIIHVAVSLASARLGAIVPNSLFLR